jgi:hypothetical protein
MSGLREAGICRPDLQVGRVEDPMATMRIRLAVLLLTAMVTSARMLAAPDITGMWTAAFDTQIGRQEYTYQFRVKGRKVTGKAVSANGESDLQNGKVDVNNVTFLEPFRYQGAIIAITYTGTIMSAQEIKFTRQVGEFATEEMVATRVTPTRDALTLSKN